jgi:hypothetical protein
MLLHIHEGKRTAKKRGYAITFTTVGRHLELVKADGEVVGFIEKQPNTADEFHPFKAFKAITGQGPVRVDSNHPMRVFDDKQNAAIYLVRTFKGVC